MCIALKPEGQQCCSIMKFSGIEEGREGAKDLFLCQVNILPCHNSQNGTLYTEEVATQCSCNVAQAKWIERRRQICAQSISWLQQHLSSLTNLKRGSVCTAHRHTVSIGFHNLCCALVLVGWTEQKIQTLQKIRHLYTTHLVATITHLAPCSLPCLLLMPRGRYE